MTDVQQNDQIRGVADLSRFQARQRPRHPAIICEGRTVTYSELDERSNQVANGLLAGGIKAGSRIAYLGKNSESFFELLLGAAKARCSLVPVNWRLAPPEIEFIIGDAAPELILAEPEYRPVLSALSERRSVRFLGTDYAEWRDAQNAADPELPPESDDVVVIMYTSGTTGFPKGAQLSNYNLLSHLRFIDSGAFGPWEPDDLQLICLPLFHVGGTDSGLWSFYTGATSLLLRNANTATLIDAFRQWPVTIAGFVPTIMKSLLDDPEIGTIDFRKLKLISYGGSPISPELMKVARERFSCRFQQLFGMTEATGAVTLLSDEDHRNTDPRLLRSCGKPLPSIELKVMDPEGRPKPAGSPGEIMVRGPVVMKGYWNRPEETANVIRDGWYMTGDAGFFDEEGYLFIHDRIKDMIVSGGENVYPTEVENTVLKHPAAAEVAVIGVPDPKWGEGVKALVVLKSGSELTSAELIDFARKHLAGYKCPKTIDFVDRLPRNAAGKLLRNQIRERYWNASDRQDG